MTCMRFKLLTIIILHNFFYSTQALWLFNFISSFFWDLNSLNILLQLTKNLHHCQNLNEKFFVPQKNCTKCKKKEKENSLIQWTFSLPQTERAKRRKVETRIKPTVCVYHSCFECRTERCCYYKRKSDNGEPEKKMIWADCSSLMYLSISQ